MNKKIIATLALLGICISSLFAIMMIIGQSRGLVPRHNMGLDFLPLVIVIIVSSVINWRLGTSDSRDQQKSSTFALIGLSGMFVTFGSIYFRVEENYVIFISACLIAQVLFLSSFFLLKNFAKEKNITLKFASVTQFTCIFLVAGLLTGLTQMITDSPVVSVITFLLITTVLRKLMSKDKSVVSEAPTASTQLHKDIESYFGALIFLYVFSTALFLLLLRPLII